MKIRHGLAITLSGVLWMGVGILLLLKGFSLLLHPSDQTSALLPFIQSLTKDAEQASLLLVSISLLIGFLKGRLVLAKTASRVIKKILSLPNPCSVSSIYGRGYLLLLASMVSLGVLLKWIPVPHDIKGVVDIAIGSALTNGSAFYFRHFAEVRRKNLPKS